MELIETHQGRTDEVFELLSKHYPSDHLLIKLLSEDDNDEILVRGLIREALTSRKRRSASVVRPLYKYRYLVGTNEGFVLQTIESLNQAAIVLNHLLVLTFQYQDSQLIISLRLT